MEFKGIQGDSRGSKEIQKGIHGARYKGMQEDLRGSKERSKGESEGIQEGIHEGIQRDPKGIQGSKSPNLIETEVDLSTSGPMKGAL